MRRIIALTIVLFLAVAPVTGQRKKATKGKPRPAPKAPATPATVPKIIGSQVEIVTKNGDHIVGEVLELSAYSLRIRADRLESTIGMDTIASLSFAEAPAPSSRPSRVAASSDFAKEASIVLGSFQSVVTNLQHGIDYTEFRRQVTELHRLSDKLVSKFSGTENVAELRIIALLTAALTDYDWSRTIWTLKLGRSSGGMALESESPALSDAFTAYPDIKSSTANGDKYEIEKIVGLLWRKASEKVTRARTLLGPPN